MTLKRVAHLDGIRGIAVALVVMHHWTTTGHALDLGNIGVQLFFVLSGFLITGILLDARASMDRGESGFRQTLSTFWRRRLARILPVFLLTLLLVALAGSRLEKPDNLPWHLLFASNLLFFLRGSFDSNLAHFWTLAVEQQFYVAWPLAVLLVPRGRLEMVILALVALAPLTRVLLYLSGLREFPQFNVLPFANFDSLGLGAAVALWMRMPETERAIRFRALSWAAAVAFVAFLANRALGRLPANMEQSFYAVVFAWVVAATSRKERTFAARILEWEPLVALGIVSYGVYVYHVFGPRLAGFGMRSVGAPELWQSGAPLFVASAWVTLAAAFASWLLMERPVLRAARRPMRAQPGEKQQSADLAR